MQGTVLLLARQALTMTISSASSVVCVQDGMVTLNFHPDAITA